MVDAQTIGVLVTTASVTVAAVYYIFTLRINMRTQELALKAQQQNLETRRLELVDSIITRTHTTDWTRNLLELLRYEWRDYEDFEKKYGSENNVESAAKRFTLWNTLNHIGVMVMKGIIEDEDIYNAGLQAGSIFLWEKYKPVISEVRRRYQGQDYLSGFEFLVGKLLGIVKERDPTYVFPETLDRYVPDK